MTAITPCSVKRIEVKYNLLGIISSSSRVPHVAARPRPCVVMATSVGLWCLGWPRGGLIPSPVFPAKGVTRLCHVKVRPSDCCGVNPQHTSRCDGGTLM